MDVRIAHTVAYLLRCPRSSVPEAMRACKFTLDESASRSKQMTIRRSFAKKATGGKLVPLPDVTIEDWGEGGCANVCVQVALHRV